MWRELLDIFRTDDPMRMLGDAFMDMLQRTLRMAQIVRPHVLTTPISLTSRKEVLEIDVEVNKLERKIRKQIVSHLSLRHSEVSFCLLLLLLVKDVERLGDFLKNISDVEQLGAKTPTGPLRDELEDLINTAMTLFEGAPGVLRDQDRDKAEELLKVAENARLRSDKLLVEISRSEFDAAQATAMVLLTRFWRRVAGHLGNVLSSVVLPVHQVDFFGDAALENED